MFNEQLAIKLYDIEAVKFGAFTLKSGIVSPIYIDLRMTVSYPAILEAVSDAIYHKIAHQKYDILCGVPYTALPIATGISLKHDKPMILRRKEVKDYGTKKILEGKYHAGQVCLVIEDLITSGSSIFETIDELESEGLFVNDAAVLLDREQGGCHYLAERGYKLHSVFTISELLALLHKNEKIDFSTVQTIKEFISSHQAPQPALR
jgi:uridine monophosphate synthetase